MNILNMLSICKITLKLTSQSREGTQYSIMTKCPQLYLLKTTANTYSNYHDKIIEEAKANER